MGRGRTGRRSCEKKKKVYLRAAYKRWELAGGPLFRYKNKRGSKGYEGETRGEKRG